MSDNPITYDPETLVEDSVREFRTKFKCSNDRNLAIRLINEELEEVKWAAVDLLKELCDLVYVIENGIQACGRENIPEDLLNECDSLGGFLDCFSDYQQLEAFNRVHISNMTKVSNDTGDKIQKGPNYVEPTLLDLMEA
jgi:hypothetical protein